MGWGWATPSAAGWGVGWEWATSSATGWGVGVGVGNTFGSELLVRYAPYAAGLGTTNGPFAAGEGLQLGQKAGRPAPCNAGLDLSAHLGALTDKANHS